MTISELQDILTRYADELGENAEVVALVPNGNFIEIRNAYAQKLSDRSEPFTALVVEIGEERFLSLT